MTAQTAHPKESSSTPVKPVTPVTPAIPVPPVPAHASCFIAGIVKGTMEREDPTAHFGSTLSLGTHLAEARSLGLLEEAGGNYPFLTDLGKAYYEHWQLAELDDGRSYMWPTNAEFPLDLPA